MDYELYVHQTLNFEGQANAGRVVDDGLHFPGTQIKRRIDGHRVAAVDSSPFHMLHDARYQYLLAVAYGINFAFFAF